VFRSHWPRSRVSAIQYLQQIDTTGMVYVIFRYNFIAQDVTRVIVTSLSCRSDSLWWCHTGELQSNRLDYCNSVLTWCYSLNNCTLDNFHAFPTAARTYYYWVYSWLA